MPLLTWVYTNIVLAVMGAVTSDGMFFTVKYFLDKNRRVRVKYSKDYPDSFCEAVNIGGKEIILKAHGVTTFDRRSDREWFGQWNKELKSQARTPLSITKNWGDQLMWHLRYMNGMVYYVYVKDNDDKFYRHYPNGRIYSWIKRFYYWTTKRFAPLEIRL